MELQREESVEASDRGRGSGGLPGRQVPRMESTLNPAATKGQLNIKLLSMATESLSPVPPVQDDRRSEARDGTSKSKWYSYSMTS